MAVVGGNRVRDFVPAGEPRALADIGSDALEAGVGEFGPDIVEDRGRNALRGHRSYDHRYDATERSPDEDRALESERVEQVKDIRGIGWRQVTRRQRVVVAEAAPAEVDRKDSAIGRIALAELGEVARVAGQAVEAQQRRLAGRSRIVAIVQPQTVGDRHISVLQYILPAQRPPHRHRAASWRARRGASGLRWP